MLPCSRCRATLRTGILWPHPRELACPAPTVLRAQATVRIERAGFTEVEYLDLRACDTLEELTSPTRPARLFAAAWLAGVRLIDNIAVE